MARPTNVDRALRRRLWVFTREALLAGRLVKIADLCQGICTTAHFYESILKRPAKLRWMLHQPEDLEAEMERLVAPVVDRCAEILKLPLTDDDGKIDHQALRAVLSVAKIVLDLTLPEKSDT